MPFVELPDVRLWYTDSGGSGTPVIMMHAATGTSDSWLNQVPAFSSAGFRCIGFDRRGWGRTEQSDPNRRSFVVSDIQGLVNELQMNTGGRILQQPQIDDLLDLLASGHEPAGRPGGFHLIGTAAGGFCAIDYALTHPQRLRSLTVACSIGGIQDPDYLEIGRRIRPPEFQALPAELREVGPSYRVANPEGTLKWLEIDRASHRQPAEPPQTPLNHVTYAALETLQVPTLLLAADADLYAPPALMRLLAARIPHCEFATIHEAGHAAFWEQPDEWNRIVLDFVQRH